MTAKVIELGAHENMTVTECLDLCRREAGGYQDVMVLAYGPDGDLVVRSSAMDRKDALWMLTAAVQHATGGIR